MELDKRNLPAYPSAAGYVSRLEDEDDSPSKEPASTRQDEAHALLVSAGLAPGDEPLANTPSGPADNDRHARSRTRPLTDPASVARREASFERREASLDRREASLARLEASLAQEVASHDENVRRLEMRAVDLNRLEATPVDRTTTLERQTPDQRHESVTRTAAAAAADQLPFTIGDNTFAVVKQQGPTIAMPSDMAASSEATTTTCAYLEGPKPLTRGSIQPVKEGRRPEVCPAFSL
jgi:hypothetical protein